MFEKPPLVGTVYDLSKGDRLQGRLIDGTKFEADVTDVESDQSGLRVELRPTGIAPDKHGYRIRVNRMRHRWGDLHFDRRESPTDDWERYAQVVDLSGPNDDTGV